MSPCQSEIQFEWYPVSHHVIGVATGVGSGAQLSSSWLVYLACCVWIPGIMEAEVFYESETIWVVQPLHKKDPVCLRNVIVALSELKWSGCCAPWIRILFTWLRHRNKHVTYAVVVEVCCSILVWLKQSRERMCFNISVLSMCEPYI